MQTPTKNQIKKRLKKIGYNQRRFAKEILRRKPQQLTQALNGEQPGLLRKALEKLEELEQQLEIIINSKK